jgi:hypothetical protein
VFLDNWDRACYAEKMSERATNQSQGGVDGTLFDEMEFLTPEQRIQWLEGMVNPILEMTSGEEVRSEEAAD